MTLTISCRSILRLKRTSYKMLDSAKNAAKSTEQDPLFQQLGDLSSLVSEIDSIKKRQGTVLKECLLRGIRGIENWEAEQFPATHGPNKEMLLCYNSFDKKIYGLVTKRGHGDYDSSSIKALNRQLSEARSNLDIIETEYELPESDKNVFVISFYGRVWNLDYNVYTPNDFPKIFNLETKFLVSSFMSFHEKIVQDKYSDRIKRSYTQHSFDLDKPPNIFLDISDNELQKNRRVKIEGHNFQME